MEAVVILLGGPLLGADLMTFLLTTRADSRAVCATPAIASTEEKNWISRVAVVPGMCEGSERTMVEM